MLWIDVDLVDYSPDILNMMLRTGKQIVHPDCVRSPAAIGDHQCNQSFDLNAWCDNGTRHMHDLRGGDELVPIDSVGGTMLLVDADLHRDGLIFPAFPYGLQSMQIRPRAKRLVWRD